MVTTARGQFRSVDMDDLHKWAKSSLWDNEQASPDYTYPIVLGRAKARSEGLRLVEGNPLAEVYELGPYICVKSSQSHIGPYRHAIDFIVPEGTPVLAARGGTVTEVEEGSNEGGPTAKFRDTLNYVTILHDGGEHSQYCHLGQYSVRDSGVAVGSRVRQGQRIGTVAMTGWTDIPHLHFIVFRNAKNHSPFTFKSLRVKFK